MVDKKLNNTAKIRIAAFLLSLLLHILLIVGIIWVPKPVSKAALPMDPSLSQPQYDRMAFELVETPPNIPDQIPSAKTDLASDQDSRANDQNPIENLSDNLPYSEGYAEAKNYPQQISPEIAETEPTDQKDNPQHSENTPNDAFMTALKEMQQQLQNDSQDFPEPAFKNLDSSVIDHGGFSFNTYNWDFAPYLLTMKRRIRSNMNLPYAFTNLGAVSGDIMVKFVVSPNGIVTGLKILNSDAHYSLEQSSVNAVQNSSAFDPLPRDFPEDKLVVTARFSFSILKN